jgi:general secretion pathway protein L
MEDQTVSLLHSALLWWLQQMSSLLPFGRRSPRDGAALIVRSCGALEVELGLRRRTVRRMVGQVSLDESGLPRAKALLDRMRTGGRVVLEVPGALMLEQQADLPLAAESELGTVLRHEMDRLTPFRADEVFWSWAIAGRDKANGRIRVTLSLVIKAGVQPLLQAMARAGLRPTTLEAPGGDGVVRSVGVVAPGAGPGRRSTAVRVAGWGCAVLALGTVVVPVVQQQRALAAVDDRIGGLQPRVALVEGLRRRVEATSGGAALMAAEGARSGNALQALAAVSRALPDDTYLTELVLRDRKLTLTGRSASAVRLIGLLSSAPELANPAFAAPVTRTVGDHGDQFTISADLAP